MPFKYYLFRKISPFSLMRTRVYVCRCVCVYACLCLCVLCVACLCLCLCVLCVAWNQTQGFIPVGWALCHGMTLPAHFPIFLHVVWHSWCLIRADYFSWTWDICWCYVVVILFKAFPSTHHSFWWWRAGPSVIEVYFYQYFLFGFCFSLLLHKLTLTY